MLVLPLGVTEPWPPEIDQFALPPENVSLTCSPTPTVRRERFAGEVATVCEVMDAVGVGDGDGPAVPGCGCCVSGCTDGVPGLFTMFANGTGAPPLDTRLMNSVLASWAGRTRT